MQNIKIKYYTISGRSSNILKGIKINDEYQFQEATTFVLSRIWQDEFDVAEKRVDGKHDIKPQSLEKQVWNEESIADTNGYYGGSYLFYFEEGDNTIEIVGVSEPVVFNSITIYQEEARKKSEIERKWYIIDASGKPLGRVAAAITALENNQFKPMLNPVVKRTFEILAPYIKDEELKKYATNIDEYEKELIAYCYNDPDLSPLVYTTTAATMLDGGSNGANVLPGPVNAVVNFRLLDSVEDCMEHFKNTVGVYYKIKNGKTSN